MMPCHDDNVPYGELDSNVLNLVRALNAFAGIKTIGSCGGHREPGQAQAREGSWWVTFEIEHSEDGGFALEFLAWLINAASRFRGNCCRSVSNNIY